MQKIIFIFACAIFFVGCASPKLPNNGNRAGAPREYLDSLRGTQSESAATGARVDEQLKAAGEQSTGLAAEITRSTNDIEELERIVASGTDDIAEFKRIVERIRERGSTTQGRAINGEAPAPKNESATQ